MINNEVPYTGENLRPIYFFNVVVMFNLDLSKFCHRWFYEEASTLKNLINTTEFMKISNNYKFFPYEGIVKLVKSNQIMPIYSVNQIESFTYKDRFKLIYKELGEKR